MIRRGIRLRKEYLFQKSLEEKEKQILDNKKRIREAIEEGKAIPTELVNISTNLRSSIDLEDNSAKAASTLDNEYGLSSLKDPKILITTSRSPSSRLVQFVKELSLIIPNSSRINRGGYILKDLCHLCRTNEASDLIIVHEHRGEPDSMIISHFPHGPTAYFGLSKITLRHDLNVKPKNLSQVRPHLIFQNFGSKLGMRISNILKFLFPQAAPFSKRVHVFLNNNDLIIFRHYTWEKKDDVKDIELEEIGPRFILKPYRIELGTIEMKSLTAEWTLKPYFNKQKSILN
ncbi:U3 small nucleolar ribonucleoprotein IMP4, putative [Cryptosporidium muris RN66]|uniref:U3 small nucleolar ribonucleoprotein IMP4, putative n=1 Tax=Cryptosporidium muris (strain RN66) TaxID=441375 RepID=B6AD22_CRYMR|nr:U3 small nucleolar ribonucleoprotein IMP4, putative [Cryptosporidium muris RN66]EEA06026.1 U3 small nucleolar ribonucleoprotein IMP4, putative [Cryptosporidium muris RN66]|eukprot:XP_002140375.1 U3 small nucleolar ribonucleoprotein IMP4 [Cryptosporidium muris RN66]